MNISNKPLGELSFEELKTEVTWHLAQALINGTQLRSAVHDVMWLTLGWQKEKGGGK